MSLSTIVYADKNNAINNLSLINHIAKQLTNVNISTDKATIQSILEEIQNQIAQTSGLDKKAIVVLNLMDSFIALNPTGVIMQPLLSLAKRQESVGGNTDLVNQTAIQIVTILANGKEDDISQPLEQASNYAASSLASQSISQQGSSSSLNAARTLKNTIQQQSYMQQLQA